MSELQTARKGAKAAASAHKRGGNVLVTCHMGLNRSGLVTAMMLHLLTPMTGERIVAHVREHRPGALCNLHFAKAISALPTRKTV
jgi:protein-tyrosine phosphatase